MRTIIVIASLLLTGCSHMANDAWSGQDKAQHFLASAMLSAAGNEYAQHQGYSRDRSAAIGLMFSVSLGASKELWDSRPAGSGWSWKDFTGCRRRDHRLRCMAVGSSVSVTDATPSLCDATSGRQGRQWRPSPSHTSRTRALSLPT